LRGSVLGRSSLISLLGCVPLVVALCSAGGAAEPLAKELDRHRGRGPLAKATVGILVVRASDGATLYAHGADRLMTPASNQKILTALASLSRFGPTHRFVTRVWAPAVPGIDGVVDELVVEGAGDPVLNSEDWWRVAAALKRDGLRGVRGDLRVDDTHFEPAGWHPSWGRPSARAYHAPVGALTANYGTFLTSIWPRGKVGLPARVEIDPPVPYLRLRNRATTVAKGEVVGVSVGRGKSFTEDGGGFETIRVEGAVHLQAGVDRVPRSVEDPGLYAGSLLLHQLEANDVFVEGNVRRGVRSEADGALLLAWAGRSVQEVVQLCMKYSNNAIAESLVKNLGAWSGATLEGSPARRGDWTEGIRALRGEVGKLGVDLSGARLIDGSGLSEQNRLSPRMLVQALEVGRSRFGFGPEFVSAMPIAGADGTLERRFEGARGRIRAKTGLLSDASVVALSGFAERADGETWIFSILVNGHGGGSRAAMDATDRLAQALLDAYVPAQAEGAPTVD